MKIPKLAGALLLGVAGFASAADPEMPAAAFDWSGAYVGANLGYAWSHADFTDAEYNGIRLLPDVHWDLDENGLLGGIQAGYNWQRGHVVFGLEGELGYLDLDDKSFQGMDPVGVPYDAYGTVDGGWYASLNARLGYAWDRTLVYGKLGAVYSRAEVGFLDMCTIAPCGDSMTDASERVGWGYQLGAGLEHAIADKWTIKAEYAYFDFGDQTISGEAVGGTFAGLRYDIDSDLTAHTLRIGANYRF
jgi:outer membrane immunogenic protein